MGDNRAVMNIAANDARRACEGAADVTERLRLAMTATKDHWLLTDDGERLRAACAGTLTAGGAADRDLIVRSYRQLVNLMAAMNGVAVDVDAVLAAQTDDLLPLMRLWYETK